MVNIKQSRLYLKRLQLGLEQKQISYLLGQKEIYKYNRIENKQRMANLKDAIKLSLIFGLPISTLFDDCFQNCQEELRKQLKNSNLLEKITLQSIEYCGYLEMMSSKFIGKEESDKIQHHLRLLVDERSKKILNHK